MVSKKYSALAVHSWLKSVNVCFIPGDGITPLVEEFVSNLLEAFRALGNVILDQPNNATDILLTSAPFNKSIPWRRSMLFTGRSRYHLQHSPVVFTVIHATSVDFHQVLEHFQRALNKEVVDPLDYEFPGLAHEAYEVLYEQGRRGEPILALERLLQGQSKSLQVLLLTGGQSPKTVFHFDLIGSFAQSNPQKEQEFYSDIALRMITRVSTFEITDHQVSEERISSDLWRSLKTPYAMQTAAKELGKRQFFTEMVQIDRLVQVPVVTGVVSRQYREGCFATRDPLLGALISTVTGSARPVDKSLITEDDLAIIEGVRRDRKGAIVRHVEGKRNDPPCSEAVEMIEMDSSLPRVELKMEAGRFLVPVLRSKLHGHRREMGA
jgi:hypothetical protein